MPVSIVPSLPPSPVQATSVPLAAWCCCAFYQRDYGLRQVPLCGPVGTRSSIQRVHAPVARKIIRWLAVGWGGVPPLPGSNTGSSNEVLEADEIGQPAPGAWLDGQPVIGVFGEYRYLLQYAPSASDLLTGCTAPYLSSPGVAVYQLTPGHFSQLFAGPSATPNGFNGQAVSW